MLAVVFGGVFVILGLWGVISWWPDFVTVFKGCVPFMFMVGGLISIVAGVTAITESIEERNARLSGEDNKGESK